jgi:diaminopimelate decarboxylase
VNQAVLDVVASDARSGCRGVVPIDARLEDWQVALCAAPDELSRLLELHGSPLNIIDPSAMARNAAELQRVADSHEIDFKMFFARKANKALALIDEAKSLGLGVDLASERELIQALGRGVIAAETMVTAAVKPAALLSLCVESGATVAIDNEDELRRISALAQQQSRRVPIALRLAPTLPEGRPETRFGTDGPAALEMANRHWAAGLGSQLDIVGVHFHLDGYDPHERVSALAECFTVIDALRVQGHAPSFVDMGGGIPMSYLESPSQWATFWHEHRRSLLGQRDALTFESHPLGLVVRDGEITGRANVYPYFQEPTRADWLERVLTAPIQAGGHGSVADALRARGLQLRCEPGRSLLDGCGLTAARVEFRKQRRDGTWLIGLAMNRTQCRSTSDDFLVDPLLVRPQLTPADAAEAEAEPVDGYLVGAYCIERELLTWRKMRFPRGVAVGDIVVFPNTAGYLMHIVESSSHQMPLARNLILRPGQEAVIDEIDVSGR